MGQRTQVGGDGEWIRPSRVESGVIFAGMECKFGVEEDWGSRGRR